MEKENECEIVQDLLLNYVDGVLHNSSKEFVEGHIKTCKGCNEKLNNIKKEIEEKEGIERQEKEIDYLKKINRKNNIKKVLLIIVSFVLVVLVMFNIAVFINYNNLKPNLNIKIFLTNDITKQEQENIEQTIREQDNKAEITYVSKEEALEQVKELYNDKKALLETYNTDNPFKAYYSVRTEKVEQVKNILETKEGISNITVYNFNPYEFFMSTMAQKLNKK